MSVMIRGMEMPKSCDDCRFANHRLGICEADKKFRAIAERERPEYCPLVPVPQHGRLIDADVLMELYADTDDLQLENMKVPIAVIRQNIMDAPTIIPASEEDE